MKQIVYGEDDRFLRWIEARVDAKFPKDAVAFGLEKDGEILAAYAYDNYTNHSICMHVAAVEGKNWLTKELLWRSFAYPFLQLNCHRVTALVKENNVQCRKFVENHGFTQEGILRENFPDKSNMIVYGLLKDECRFLRIKS
jgi:RimJ/RimL family protein N-acetyltransferase